MLFSLVANMRSERSVLQGDRRSNDFVESRAEDGESVTGVRLRIFQPREARRRLKFWVGQLVGRLYGFLDCRGNLGRTTQPKQKQNMTKELGHDCVWHSRVYWDAENLWVLSRGAWR